MNDMLKQLSIEIRKNSIKGFLNEDEATCLYYYACRAATQGPCLEVGSYCGKSTIYLAKACQQFGGAVYAVDHHQGSEEHQVGEQYHDPELFNFADNTFDSFPTFRKTLKLFGVEDTVVPIVAASEVAARHWQAPLAMVFVDGGHSEESATHDCFAWGRSLMPGGIFAMHDIYLTEHEGGQAPRRALNALFATGNFIYERKVGSLVLLKAKRTCSRG